MAASVRPDLYQEVGLYGFERSIRIGAKRIQDVRGHTFASLDEGNRQVTDFAMM